MQRSRLATSIVLAAVLILTLALAAAAAGYAQCGGGGFGYTSAGGSGFRTHKFGSHQSTVSSPATVTHGWFTGQQYWDVTGSGSENGWCVG